LNCYWRRLDYCPNINFNFESKIISPLCQLPRFYELNFSILLHTIKLKLYITQDFTQFDILDSFSFNLKKSDFCSAIFYTIVHDILQHSWRFQISYSRKLFTTSRFTLMKICIIFHCHFHVIYTYCCWKLRCITLCLSKPFAVKYILNNLYVR
jgi:hypothetical protein